MLVRREAAEQVGWLDPDFFVYSDETDFCKRLHDAGWRDALGAGRAARSTTTSWPPTRRAPSAASWSSTAAATATCASTTPRRAACSCAADGRGPTWPARWRRRCCRATTRGAICCTPASPCDPGTARGSARRRRSTTGAQLTPLNGVVPTMVGSMLLSVARWARRRWYFVGVFVLVVAGLVVYLTYGQRPGDVLNANVPFSTPTPTPPPPSQSCLRRPRRRSRSRSSSTGPCTATTCSAPTTCRGPTPSS